jgi:hypothetical protein
MSSARYRGWLYGLPAVAAFFLGTPAAVGQYEARIVAQTPSNYWRLNETTGTNAAARIGTINGVYMANPTLGQAGPRPPAQQGFEATNNAPRFDGANSFFATDQSFFNNAATFTMSGWFFQTANQGGDRIGLWGQNDVLEFGFINPTAIELWTPGGGSVQAPWDGTLNNRWNHLAAVGNGTNLLIYMNGALIGTGGSATTNYGMSADPFRIGGGGITDATGNFYNGLIDEIAIWTNRALTAAEIQAQYTAGITPIPEPVSLFLGTTGMLGVAGVVWRRRKAAHT